MSRSGRCSTVPVPAARSYTGVMADPKKAWSEVGDAMSALGLKLKLHTEQEMSDDGKEFTSALERLAGTVNDIFEGVGRARICTTRS